VHSMKTELTDVKCRKANPKEMPYRTCSDSEAGSNAVRSG
jgi:hypothetical protein